MGLKEILPDYVQTLVTLISFCLLTVHARDTVCSTPGASPQGTSCFLASRFYTTWTDAYTFCSAMGCSLAAPENIVKISEIRDYAERVHLYRDFYLGGTDAGSEGTFVRAGTGSALVALPWAPGEPSGHARENCLMTDSVEEFRMYDTDCEEERRFICDCPTESEKAESLVR